MPGLLPRLDRSQGDDFTSTSEESITAAPTLAPAARDKLDLRIAKQNVNLCQATLAGTAAARYQPAGRHGAGPGSGAGVAVAFALASQLAGQCEPDLGLGGFDLCSS